LGTHYNHEPLRERKLLLQKKELRKLENKIKEKGYTIVPLKIFISKNGFAKMEIGLGKGKKIYDKRESIKSRESDRDVKRKYGI
jgi:SsrA-binding protein